MAGLGETTARLVSARRALHGSAGPSAGGTMTEVRGFGFNPGALRMMTYVPADLPPGAPLVVVLHGCTQDAAGYARGAGWLTLADRLGFAVLAPQQDRGNNANGCFNWFEPGDSGRSLGEAASIHAMVEHILDAGRLDPDRVFVTGLSAGGAMATVMLAAYPETFAAGAVVAGLPFGIAQGVQEAFGAMRGSTRLSSRELGDLVAGAAPPSRRRPRLAVWHGLADGTVASANAHALSRQWASVHGLPEAPQEVMTSGGWTRSIWRGPDDQALIESNLLAGVGHGAPLAAGGDDPIGEAAPYLLETGVSSSLEISRFWGLAPARAWDDEAAAPSASSAAAPAGAFGGLGEGVMAAVSPHVPADVEAVIAASLRAAGLMRERP